jgi:hypothetical protein
MRRVFLSYHWPDRQHVERARTVLRSAGLDTFFDQESLNVGQPWPLELEQVLGSVEAVVVFVGHHIGGWQKREMWFALDRQKEVEEKGGRFAVVPVPLPGAMPERSFLFQNTWIDARSEALEREALAKLVRTLRSESADSETAVTSICPYRGLHAFEEEDSPFFFGREGFTESLVHKVRDERRSFVAVVGCSGSGKSSVVKAGLIPALRKSRPPHPAWDVLVMRPGDDPYAGLARAALSETEPDLTPDQLFNRIADTVRNLHAPGKLGEYLGGLLGRSKGTDRLLLVIDQFEELFTVSRKEQERSDELARPRSFIEAVFRATEQTPVSVVITLRADFYDSALSLSRELSDTLSSAQISLGSMNDDEIKSTIVKPAKLAGIKIEPSFVAILIADVKAGNARGNFDALPLLEYTLTDLYQRGAGVLSYDKYNGIEGVLADRAEAVWKGLTEDRQRIARGLLLKLVNVAEPDVAGGDTKRGVHLADLSSEEIEIVDEFTKKETRLLVTGGALAEERARNSHSQPADSRTGTVEFVHEALIRHWVRFQDWLSEDRKFRLWTKRMEGKQREWEKAGRPRALLLRRIELREARGWFPTRERELLGNSRVFLKASFSAQRWRIAGLVAVLLGFALGSSVWWFDWRERNALDALQRIGLSSAACQDDSLRNEPRCRRLVATKIFDAEALVSASQHLNRSRSLRELILSGTQVKNVEVLKGLTGLQTLYLNNTQVQNVEALKGLTGLHTLYLNNTQIQNVEALKGLTGLQTLNLSMTHVQNFEALKGLIGLQTLDLSGTQVQNFQALSGLTGLQTLNLSMTHVQNFEALKGLTGLQGLYLNNTQVQNVEALKGLTSLQTLDLSDTQVQNVEALSGLTGLQTLDLSGTQVQNVEALKAALPRTNIRGP